MAVRDSLQDARAFCAEFAGRDFLFFETSKVNGSAVVWVFHQLDERPMSGSRSPFPAALAYATQRKHTCELLGRAIRNLEDLQQQIDQLRQIPAAELSVEFSHRQLESLGRILGEGRERLERRRGELGVVPSIEPAPRGTTVAEPPISMGRRQLKRFMRSYRACGRFLGNVLRKTHGGADSATAASVAQLLHNLEKQLWLLECRPVGVGAGAGLLAVTFFRSC
jgi:hypothetical protein